MKFTLFYSISSVDILKSYQYIISAVKYYISEGDIDFEKKKKTNSIDCVHHPLKFYNKFM